MTGYLIDTNILSRLFKKDPDKDLQRKINQLVTSGHDVCISGITYYEIKRGLLSINAKGQLNQFENLCREYKIIWLDNQELFDEASNIYADLYRNGKLISDADILIAAAAKLYNLILISDDVDFRVIDRLQVVSSVEWLNKAI